MEFTSEVATSPWSKPGRSVELNQDTLEILLCLNTFQANLSTHSLSLHSRQSLGTWQCVPAFWSSNKNGNFCNEEQMKSLLGAPHWNSGQIQDVLPSSLICPITNRFVLCKRAKPTNSILTWKCIYMLSTTLAPIAAVTYPYPLTISITIDFYNKQQTKYYIQPRTKIILSSSEKKLWEEFRVREYKHYKVAGGGVRSKWMQKAQGRTVFLYLTCTPDWFKFVILLLLEEVLFI